MDTSILTPQDIFTLPVRYEIPDFQRRYIWTKENQWEPMWEDITDIAEDILENYSFSKKHFLGAVVLQPKARTGNIKSGIVIDGQQRLTTLQLMIAAVQEILARNDCDTEAKQLRTLVENRDYFVGSEPNYKFKIWPTTFDRDAFCDAMDEERSSSNSKHSLVVLAHEFFKEQTQYWLDTESAGKYQLNRRADALARAIQQHLELVVIDLGSEDPHLIFETMNARGTPLLQSDMVKNNILYDANIYSKKLDRKLPKKSELWSFDEDSQGYWAQEIGRGFHRRPRIDVFLNHWLTFQNRKLVGQFKEFETFRKYSKHQQEKGSSIYDIASDIITIGKTYRKIDECTFEPNQSIEPFLNRCKVMNLGAVTPLLLQLLTSEILQNNPTVLRSCIRILDSFFVRRAICGYHARRYANIGERLLRLLDEARESADQSLRNDLREQTSPSELWPSDTELKQRFLEVSLYQRIPQSRLCMVLRAIEEYIHRTRKPQTQSISPDLQIEHIMPVAWKKKDWPLPNSEPDEIELADMRNVTIHTIGNLTLVSSPLNPELSNKPWEKKKRILDEHNVLFLNKDLVKLEDWDEQSIRERSLQLYEYACKIWPHADQIME